MLAGIEAMAMLAKGQARAVPRGDMPAQRAFVQQIFSLGLSEGKWARARPQSANATEPDSRGSNF
jgi:hypothetical protein